MIRTLLITTLIEWALKLSKPHEPGRMELSAAQIKYCKSGMKI